MKEKLTENNLQQTDNNIPLGAPVINTSVHFTSEKDFWETPQELFDELNKEFNFTLDPCSSHQNAKCKKHYTISDDGLSKSWKNEIVFVNPPYGRQIHKWVKKCYVEYTYGATVVLLIPARTDTSYWHNWIFNRATEIRYLRGRVKFALDGKPMKAGAPFPSAIVVYKNASECL